MPSGEVWPERIQALMDGRPVRWADARQVIGDYDGRERTLEVFNADAKDQRVLLRRLRPLRTELETAAGGPVIVIFHTITESERLYGDFVRAALREAAMRDADVAYDLEEDAPGLALDVALHEREGAKAGSAELPRVAA